MPDHQALLTKTQQFATRIASSAKKHENILIVCHHDADGICSAALMSRFIFKEGGHCQIRAISEPSRRTLERLAQGRFDLVLFLDLASGISDDISKVLGDKWLAISHQGISEEDSTARAYTEKVLNPWQFGIDGSSELSTTGLVHFLSGRTLSAFSAFFAVVGAIADGQDIGPKRSLVGLNSNILEEAKSSDQIDSRVDLLFYGRDTRPVHESVAGTVTCFIPGLTGNKDACLASLRGAGIDLKSNSRWKTIADLGEEEKQQVLAAITPHLSGMTSSVEDLVGTTYSLASEDEYSPMREARDFASVLNVCGRMNTPSMGLSLCLGREAEARNEIDKVLSHYITELVRSVQLLVASSEKMIERPSYSIIMGDGLVTERMTGSVCQALSSLNRFKKKLVLLRTTMSDGDVKVSARLGKGAEYNVGQIMSSIAAAASGVGGGHATKGGVRFSISKQQEFQLALDAQVQSVRK